VLSFGCIQNSPPSSFFPLHIFGNYNYQVKGGGYEKEEIRNLFYHQEKNFLSTKVKEVTHMKVKTSSIFWAVCLMILAGLMFQPIANAADYFIHSMPVYALEINDVGCSSGGTFREYGECRLDWMITPSQAERNSAMSYGWKDLGIAFYISLAEIPGTVPLYRLYNPDSSDHLFTVSLAERNSLMGRGYLEDGIVGYVLPAHVGGMGSVRLLRFYAGGDNTYHRYSLKTDKQWTEVLEGEACHAWPSDMALVSISVTAPKQYEKLQGNSEYKITWSRSRTGGYVDVFYSKLYGTATEWIPIAYGAPSTGSLTWKVPNVDTTTASIQIVWWDNLFGLAHQMARVQSKLFTIKGVPLKIKVTKTAIVAKPSAPSALAAKTASALETQLTWKASTGGAIGYVVERRISQGMFMQIANIKAPGLAFSDKNVTPGTNYSYRVYAYNMGGHSDYSNEASAKTAFVVKIPIPMKQKSTK
jgi:hypothetical protein